MARMRSLADASAMPARAAPRGDAGRLGDIKHQAKIDQVEPHGARHGRLPAFGQA
jgi:hypothetical protein